jgi:hypothetical protein
MSRAARHFRAFLHRCSGIDFDLMLEVKDKEKSAALALRIAGARKAEAQR